MYRPVQDDYQYYKKKKKKKKKKKIYLPTRLVAGKGFSPSTLATVNTNITCRNN